MPALHKNLARLNDCHEWDGKQDADDKITTLKTGKADRSAKNSERKSTLNIRRAACHWTERNWA
jgi:hypothetical protein